MSKIIGGILSVIGFILFCVLCFLYMNSSAYLNYNDPTTQLSFFQTGYGAPAVICFLMLAIGLTFMFVSKEPNLK